VLRQAGLDVDRDVQTIIRWPGDYAMDLRRLREGTIDAAMIGDTIAPEAIAAENGWQVLAFVGDHFQIPTVGVAIDPTYTDPDDPALHALIRAHRRALHVIHNDPATTIQHMQTFLGHHTEDEVRTHYEKFIAPYFSTDGRTDLNTAQTGLTALATELGTPATFTAAEFYRTATTSER
jgi:ABC-type nitrate/sulfonate/bicarbonate transport system substrate-binding protein